MSSLNSCKFWDLFDTVKEKCRNGELDSIELTGEICRNIDDVESLLRSDALALELIGEAFGDVCGQQPWVSCHLISIFAVNDIVLMFPLCV